MKCALVTNIQRFSLHDGPGVRTTVFLQGCNLRCKWCHNPETIPSEPVLLIARNRCVRCGSCVAACPMNALRLDDDGVALQRALCMRCGSCAHVCPTGAVAMSSGLMSEEEIVCAVLRDAPFYASTGGGATLSGGEPMLQYEAVRAVLIRLHARGIHTALDTAGHVPFERYQELATDVDLFLVDYKLFDEAKHREMTGVSPALIRTNLRRFIMEGYPLWVRVPVIPGMNDGEADLCAIARDLADMQFSGPVELLPFHSLGASKYSSLGIPYALDGIAAPSGEAMEERREWFAREGLHVR